MSPVRRFAVGVALATVATFAIATPASAHDQLISSSPSADERLTEAPESITMTFSGELLVLDASLSGTVVLVVDESGTDWVADDVTVDGRTVTVALAPDMPDAGYQVRWQVVSEDGHPIAGVIPFTVGDAAPMEMSTTATADAGSNPSQSAEQSADDGGIGRLLLIGAGGAAAAVLLFAVIRILRRPRTAAAPPETGGTAADDL